MLTFAFVLWGARRKLLVLLTSYSSLCCRLLKVCMDGWCFLQCSKIGREKSDCLVVDLKPDASVIIRCLKDVNPVSKLKLLIAVSRVTSLTLICKTVGRFDELILSDKQSAHSTQPSVMSEESQRGMRGPPPASQPPMGHRVPDQFAYIPGQERSFGHCQPNVHPQHLYSTASPLVTGEASGNCSSLPPPPPPIVDHHSLPPPPPHLHGNPPPMFSRPPPPVPPPRFSQPPPAMPRTPNIPYQAAFRNPPMMAPRECSSMWQQHNPPPVPWCPQLQGDRGPPPITHPMSAEGTPHRDSMRQKEEEDSRWLEEFEKRVKSCPPPPPSPTESTTARKNVKVTTDDFIDACLSFFMFGNKGLELGRFCLW